MNMMFTKLFGITAVVLSLCLIGSVSAGSESLHRARVHVRAGMGEKPTREWTPFGYRYTSKDGFKAYYEPDKVRGEEYVRKFKSYIAKMKLKSEKTKKKGGTEPPYWGFVPTPQVPAFPNKGNATWSTKCFDSVNASVSYDTSTEEYTYTIDMSGNKFLCRDFYLFGSLESSHPKEFVLPGSYEIKWRAKEGEVNSVNLYGIGASLFPFPEVEVGANIYKTSRLYMSKGEDMYQANQEFVQEQCGWPALELRQEPVTLLNSSEVMVGDMLAIQRWDGLFTLVEWGSGGHTGHTAVVAEVDGELVVCESTASDPLDPNSPYWPPPYGVIKTPFDKWMELAQKADYAVNVLRLSPERRAAWNTTAFNTWFKEVQGGPYGFHNFIFSFFDTPTNNLPRPISPHMIWAVFNTADRLTKNTTQSSVYNLVVPALNKRLGTECYDLACLTAAVEQNSQYNKIGITDVMQIPEQDAWTYHDGKSMVCSVFVIESYKAAGVFGALTDQIQGTEQTPRDAYQMKIFEENWQRPEQCNKNDDFPYCQIMGKYKLLLPKYNTIEPYAHMNEHCDSLPPNYDRGANPTTC